MTVPADFLEQAARRMAGGEGELGGFVFVDEVAEANPYHDAKGRFAPKRGVGGHSPALAAKLDEVEGQIAKRTDGEDIFVLSPNGEVIETNSAIGNSSGDPGVIASVSLSGSASKYQGAIVTHNHPAMGDSPDVLRKYDTFSPDDIKSAMGMGLSEARMVNGVATHVLKPGPGGWGTPRDLNDAALRVISGGSFKDKVGNHVYIKRIDLTRELAKEMGWSFEVIPNA